MIEIVVGLASDVDTIFFQDILRKRPAAPGEAPRQIMHGVGNPLSAHFDDADFQLGKALRNSMKHKRMERTDDREFKFREAWIVGEKIVGGKRAIGRVHADRQIQRARLFVQRIKIRIAQTALDF